MTVPWIPFRHNDRAQDGLPADATACRPGLLVDEAMKIGDASVVAHLGRRGWDVRSSDEMGLSGWPDEQVYAAAARERWVLVTRDNGYFGNQRYPLVSCAGVVVVPGGDEGVVGKDGGVAEVLEFVAEVLARTGGTWTGSKIEMRPDGVMRMIRAAESGADGAIIERRFRRVDGVLCAWVE